jgi:AcrR family transcriptional regulator
MSTHVKTARPSKADVVTDFRRTQLIQAARERFSRHGISGTTIDGIAQAAGVAKGTVYLYYKSKDDIFRQILDEDLTQFHEETVPAISGPGDLESTLRGFFVDVLGFFDRKRDFCEHAIFELAPEQRKKALQRFEVVYQAQLGAWQARLAEAQRDGLVGPLDPHVTAITIVGTATGLVKHRLRGWSTVPLEEIANAASRTFWKGLAAR